MKGKTGELRGREPVLARDLRVRRDGHLGARELVALHEAREEREARAGRALLVAHVLAREDAARERRVREQADVLVARRAALEATDLVVPAHEQAVDHQDRHQKRSHPALHARAVLRAPLFSKSGNHQ